LRGFFLNTCPPLARRPFGGSFWRVYPRNSLPEGWQPQANNAKGWQPQANNAKGWQPQANNGKGWQPQAKLGDGQYGGLSFLRKQESKESVIAKEPKARVAASKPKALGMVNTEGCHSRESRNPKKLSLRGLKGRGNLNRPAVFPSNAGQSIEKTATQSVASLS